MADLRKQRYDMATIPAEEHAKDPAIIFPVVKQLVLARGEREIGDLIVILAPRGTGQDTSRYLSKQLEDRDNPLAGLPGLPGGPRL